MNLFILLGHSNNLTIAKTAALSIETTRIVDENDDLGETNDGGDIGNKFECKNYGLNKWKIKRVIIFYTKYNELIWRIAH